MRCNHVAAEKQPASEQEASGLGHIPLRDVGHRLQCCMLCFRGSPEQKRDLKSHFTLSFCCQSTFHPHKLAEAFSEFDNVCLSAA